jgi:arginine/lysine/ornithine decarboxylase
LEEKQVFVELADPYQVLLTLPLLKKEEPSVYVHLQKMDWKITADNIDFEHQAVFLQKTKEKNFSKKGKITSLAYTYKEMEKRSWKWVQLEDAISRISAKMVIPYPPGIPLFMTGEELTHEKITNLKKWMEAGAHFQGDHHLEENRLAVFI